MSENDTKFSIYDKKVIEYQHMIYKQLKAKIKSWDNLSDDEIILMFIYHRELFNNEVKIEFLKWIGDL